jgi:hypothetical protein
MDDDILSFLIEAEELGLLLSSPPPRVTPNNEPAPVSPRQRGKKAAEAKRRKAAQ